MSDNKNTKQDGYTEVSRLYYFLILSFGLFSILIGNLIYEKTKLWATFIIELGIAFIIALIVIATIERFQRRHQNSFIENTTDLISSNVFKAIYKRLIPEAILKELESCILNARVIRKEHEIHYSIMPFPNGLHPKHVLCKAVSTYKFENITNEPIIHKVSMTLEKPVLPELNEYCKIDSIKIDNQLISLSDIQKQIKDTNDTFRFETTVEIPANGTISVQSCATLVKYKLDIENWEFSTPSTGIRISLKCIDPSLQLELFAKARHSKELIEKLSMENHKEWELKHGIFPHQSVVLWWKEKGQISD